MKRKKSLTFISDGSIDLNVYSQEKCTNCADFDLKKSEERYMVTFNNQCHLTGILIMSLCTSHLGLKPKLLFSKGIWLPLPRKNFFSLLCRALGHISHWLPAMFEGFL